ncbi:MAG: DsbA family protein [Pseudomonadota bacterium]
MKPKTRVKSILIGILASQRLQVFRQRMARLQRRGKPTVHYFHQVDDPYSHLAVQRVDEIGRKYRVNLVPHLTSGEADSYRGDAALYPRWALTDARAIAAGYRVSFPAVAEVPPDPARVAANNTLAAHLARPDFAAVAIAVGEAFWSGSLSANESTPEADLAIAVGNRRRRQLGHYAGGMFYFEGEWYWGLDRLYLLEARLVAEGLGESPLLQPRPVPVATGPVDAKDVTLEYFPSLRSPYTAISFEATRALAKRTGARLVTRPVMPMMMRGVPAPRRKQVYIMTDAAREARASHVPFGRIVDPFGEPVKRAFALLPWVIEQGRLEAFVGEYLAAAWAKGIDVTSDKGLAEVVSAAGLDWATATTHLADTAEAEAILDANVNDMLAAGLWGVPSYRVSGGTLSGSYSCWGQDRLWRVEAEIIERAGVGVAWCSNTTKTEAEAGAGR